MFHPLSLYIGLRYTKAKRKNNFISFISFVSIGGIALGITTMIVVLSVMNGFQHEVKERSLSMSAHVAIRNSDLEEKYISNWKDVAEIAKKNESVVGVAPFTNGQGLLSYEGMVKPAQIQGIDPEFEPNVSIIDQKLRKSPLDYTKSENINSNVPLSLSELKPGEFNIILGIDLARALGVKAGDKIFLISSEIDVNAIGVSPRMKRFNVIGAFDLGMYEYDSNIALIHIEDAGRIYRAEKGSVEGVRLKVTDISRAIPIALAVHDMLTTDIPEKQYSVYDWTQQFAGLFRMIQIEKMSMFVIMSLIIAVAVFNVVSMLVMVVTDKQADIAILRTMGLSPKNIMIIFMVQGTIIGFLGAIIGIILGILIASNVTEIVRFIERLFNSQLFDHTMYPVSDIPSLILVSDVSFVAGLSFLLASMATLYPAWKASKIQPAQALRYE